MQTRNRQIARSVRLSILCINKKKNFLRVFCMAFISYKVFKHRHFHWMKMPVHYDSTGRMLRHAARSFSSEYAAFAGLVEGSLMASIPVDEKIYFIYILCDKVPLQKIRLTLLSLMIWLISFGTTSLIELSEEPVTVQECMESHSAK